MKTLRRILWLVIDGVPFWLIEHLIQKGYSLPVLDKYYHQKKLIPLSPIAPNCQTPPSLASLFWGLKPIEHSIIGYDNPIYDEKNPMLHVPSFSVRPSKGMPIWERMANAGGKLSLCQVPFVDVNKANLNLEYFSYGFNDPIFTKKVINGDDLPQCFKNETTTKSLMVEFLREQERFCILIINQKASIDSEQKKIYLKEGQWITIDVDEDSSSAVGLFRINDKIKIIFLGAWNVRFFGENVAQIQNALKESPFFAAALSKEYRSGSLGCRLNAGGSGQAEKIFISALEILAKRYQRELTTVLQFLNSDLVITYQPAVDLALHELTDLIINETGENSYRYGEQLILRILNIIESSLLEMERFAKHFDYVLVCSDHGMRHVDMIVFPNTSLFQMGYLSSKGNSIDPSKSLCFFHPSETGVIFFNKLLLKQTKKTFSYEQILDRLVSYISHSTNRSCSYFKSFPVMSDLEEYETSYFLAPGSKQYFKSQIAQNTFEKSSKSGDHSVFNHDPYLQGILIDIKGNLFDAQQKQLMNVSDVLNLMAI